MRKIKFYYDVISPYSWLAFEVLCRFKKIWNLDLDLCPFFLGGVMRSTENKAPSLLPAKAPYMLKDLMRQSEYYQISLQIPSNFLSNTILAMRLLTVVKAKSEQNLESLSRALWQRHYGLGLEITSIDAMKECLAKADISTASAEEYLALTQEESVKEQLKVVTQSAIDKGAFGAPTFFVETPEGEEMFFGSDRFHLVAQLLGVKSNGPNL
ncbi:MAG: DsbA family protein [bacterium]|nr:DsbA family protein [bacterium]